MYDIDNNLEETLVERYWKNMTTKYIVKMGRKT